jgi:hypothetical protein
MVVAALLSHMCIASAALCSCQVGCNPVTATADCCLLLQAHVTCCPHTCLQRTEHNTPASTIHCQMRCLQAAHLALLAAVLHALAGLAAQQLVEQVLAVGAGPGFRALGGCHVHVRRCT